jgi:hypothetical protein
MERTDSPRAAADIYSWPATKPTHGPAGGQAEGAGEDAQVHATSKAARSGGQAGIGAGGLAEGPASPVKEAAAAAGGTMIGTRHLVWAQEQGRDIKPPPAVVWKVRRRGAVPSPQIEVLSRHRRQVT